MAVLAKIKNGVQHVSIKQVLLLAFSIRIAWYLFILFTNPDGFWLYDSNGYWNIAYNIKEYGVFSMDAQPPLMPDYFRTPLYPLLIYPTLYFDISGCSVPVINIGVDCLSCWLIYKIIAGITKNKNYAKLGSLVYALHIPAIVFSSFVLTETVFAFLILLFVHLFLQLNSNLQWKNAVLCGLAGGLCVMCKPLGFVLIFPAVLFLLVKHKLHTKTILATVLLVFVFYAVQFPWMQRNKNVYGHYFNSVLGEYLILDYHASNVYAKANHINFNYAQDILRDKFYANLDYDPYKHPYEYAKLIEQKSYEILWAHKFIFLKEHVKECMKFFIQPLKGYTNFQLGYQHAYTKIITWLFLVIQVVVTAAIGFCILFAFYKRILKRVKFSWLIYFLVVIILLFSQFNTMPYTDGRMRMPVDPLLILLCILSVYSLVHSKTAKTQLLI